MGPRFVKAYKKVGSEKSSTDGYLIFLKGYARSPFRDFECCLSFPGGWDKKKFQLIKEQYDSYFVTNDLPPGVCSIKDFSEVVYAMGNPEGTLKLEYVDLSMKAKLTSTRFGLTLGT